MMGGIMLYPELEERLRQARHALKGATTENIIAFCRRYLALLAEYRIKLYEQKTTAGSSNQSASSSSTEDTSETRKAVRSAIEDTTRERNRFELLLFSLTTVSGYEAVEIFNRQKYEEHDDWELRSGAVKSGGSSGDGVMTIQEAVDIAGLLRREEYIAQNAAQAFD
jgi:hypothetical protein